MDKFNQPKLRTARPQPPLRFLMGISAAAALAVVSATAAFAQTDSSAGATATSTASPAMSMSSSSMVSGTGAPGATDVAMPPMQPNGQPIDYMLLTDKSINHFDLTRARAYGLTDDQIAEAYALSKYSYVSFGSILDQVENGSTYQMLADKYGVSLDNISSPQPYRDRIANYEAAYNNTGVQGWMAAHPGMQWSNPSTESSMVNGTGNVGAITTNPTMGASASATSMPAPASESGPSSNINASASATMPSASASTSTSGTSASVTAPSATMSGSSTATVTPPAVTTPPASGTATQSIADVVHSDGRFTQLASALTAANLDGYLRGNGPFTLFAPTDAAFAKLPQDQLAALMANPATLSKVLQFHLVGQSLMSSSIPSMASPSVTSIEGDSLSLSSTGGVVTVNGATVTQADMQCSNGVIHAIDTVLIPSSVNLSNLTATPAAAPATSTTTAPSATTTTPDTTTTPSATTTAPDTTASPSSTTTPRTTTPNTTTTNP